MYLQKYDSDLGEGDFENSGELFWWLDNELGQPLHLKGGLAVKNSPKKTQKTTKKPKKKHIKKLTKNGFLVFFGVFLNFLFFMKVIKTFSNPA
jgi:hypothetical protein